MSISNHFVLNEKMKIMFAIYSFPKIDFLSFEALPKIEALVSSIFVYFYRSLDKNLFKKQNYQ